MPDVPPKLDARDGCARPRTVAAVTLALLALATIWNLRRAAGIAIAWEPELREKEAELARLAR